MYEVASRQMSNNFLMLEYILWNEHKEFWWASLVSLTCTFRTAVDSRQSTVEQRNKSTSEWHNKS